MKKIIIIFCIFQLFYSVHAATSVSQHGITWTFSGDHQVGQFVSGDYWVIGPVTITSITPSFSGGRNGWEVNPVSNPLQQGFDSRIMAYNAGLVPSLPYSASPGDSIVKTISGPGTGTVQIKTAAVLTVVGETPQADAFRPPYVGDDKPYFLYSDLNLNLIPSYPAVSASPGFGWVADKWNMIQFDHIGGPNRGGGVAGRASRATDNFQIMDGYGATIGHDIGKAGVVLLEEGTVEGKKGAIVGFIQYGIDLHYMVLSGQRWPSGDGHETGRKIPIMFAAALFDHEGMKETANMEFYEHDAGIHPGKNGPVFGFGSEESSYWSTGGAKSAGDPYGFIDGGSPPNYMSNDEGAPVNYQCKTLSAWMFQALAMQMMPELQEVFFNQDFLDYCDRNWDVGIWTQPDPCAPPSQGGGDAGNGRCVLDPDLTPGSTFESFSCQPGAECGRAPRKQGSRGCYAYTAQVRYLTAAYPAYRSASSQTCAEQSYYCCPSGMTCSALRSGSGCVGSCCASSSDCVSVPTCSTLGGTCCPSGQTCSGTHETASDCDICCIGTCQVGGTEIIIDNLDSGFSSTGSWPISGFPGAYSSNSVFSKVNEGSSAVWTASLTPGMHNVYAWWTAGAGRANDAKYTVTYSGDLETVVVDQKVNGGQWNLLGSYIFGNSGTVTLSDESSDPNYVPDWVSDSVCADAIRFIPVGSGSFHPADTDESGCVELDELNNYIQQYKSNQGPQIMQVMEAIEIWLGC